MEITDNKEDVYEPTDNNKEADGNKEEDNNKEAEEPVEPEYEASDFR